MPDIDEEVTGEIPGQLSYTPTEWADGADGGTPVNAANLGNMESAIVALIERTAQRVVEGMIADKAVTGAKIADGAVGTDQLGEEVQDTLSQITEDTGWIDLYYIAGKTRIRARRVGSVVCVTGESIGHYDIGGNKWINITTVPERFRPNKRTEVPFNLNVAAGVRSYMEETGEFYVTCTVSSCSTWGFSVCYPV